MTTLKAIAAMLTFTATMLTLSTGCSSVKPWEHGIHGSYMMRSDRDALDAAYAEHVHFTREAASGGKGVGGGGCGCN